MDTSSSANDELELKPNKSKNITKLGRNSKGIGTSGTIIINSGESIRTGMEFVNDYRGATRYGSNKEKVYRDKNKDFSPKKLVRNSITYSSLNIDRGGMP